MAGFKIDRNNTAGFKLLPEGEYEVYPSAYAKEVAKTSGNKMVVFNYTVRDDVDQEGKGQEIRFDNFVETEKAMWRINQAGVAAGLDEDKDYADIYEWAEDFVNKAVRVRVEHETNDRGKTYPTVVEFLPSMYGGVREEPKEDNALANEDAAAIDVSDDDLPF